MKRIIGIFTVSIFIITSIGCDEVKELTNIDFSVTLQKVLPVDVASTNEMTNSILLDATTDPEIQEYINNIEGYEITELKFAIENYQEDTEKEIYFNGQIGFSSKTANAATTSCAVSNLPVTNFANTGDFELSTCTQILSDISAILTADNAVKIYLTGTFSGAPLSFDLKTTTKVKVTARPL